MRKPFIPLLIRECEAQLGWKRREPRLPSEEMGGGVTAAFLCLWVCIQELLTCSHRTGIGGFLRCPCSEERQKGSPRAVLLLSHGPLVLSTAVCRPLFLGHAAPLLPALAAGVPLPVPGTGWSPAWTPPGHRQSLPSLGRADESRGSGTERGLAICPLCGRSEPETAVLRWAACFCADRDLFSPRTAWASAPHTAPSTFIP